MELRLALALVLLGLSACSESAIATASRRQIVIEHSRFDPAEINVREGDTITFVIRNTDPIDHELIIGNTEVQRAHEAGTEEHHGTKPGEVTIPAGTTRETTYTFASAGRLIYGCHLPRHYDYGMRGVISVRP
ncbi:MAG TPA: plastocyanin/azurin family copper-binding protein [Actinomycetota bacterium]|nr:plastocyanin/azurin family copper-binding protein [Actinomycetota bacterium]